MFGSGDEPELSKAERLGAWLADQAVHLLTGGGGGVMAAVSRAFHEVSGRRGLIIGVVPCGTAPAVPKTGYPNPWVELPIFTHLPLSGPQGTDPMSRNHINVLSSDVIVVLKGKAGTLAEVELAARYKRPLIAYLDHRDDLPGLRNEIMVSSRLEDVQAFVSEQLSYRPRDSGAQA